jgi:hypothetical protein
MFIEEKLSPLLSNWQPCTLFIIPVSGAKEHAAEGPLFGTK